MGSDLVDICLVNNLQNCWSLPLSNVVEQNQRLFFFSQFKDLVCNETVMLHWWEIERRKFGIKQKERLQCEVIYE